MAPSFQQPLSGQGVQRISACIFKFKNKKKTQIGIRLRTWNISSLCGGVTEVAEILRKRKVDICGLPQYNEGAKELVLLELKKEDTNYGGREMMLERIVWE